MSEMLKNAPAPAYRPNPATVTFLNGTAGDITKWWTHIIGMDSGWALGFAGRPSISGPFR
jgi:hypothetical protein